MDNSEMSREDIFMESLIRYHNELGGLINDMDNDTMSTKNPILGQVVNILKLVYTSMENPYVLEELDSFISLFVAKQLLDHFDDKGLSDIRELISKGYEENNKK